MAQNFSLKTVQNDSKMAPNSSKRRKTVENIKNGRFFKAPTRHGGDVMAAAAAGAAAPAAAAAAAASAAPAAAAAAAAMAVAGRKEPSLIVSIFRLAPLI